MTSIAEQINIYNVENEIQTHLAWVGTISGLHAEALLKGQKYFVYLLRSGEFPSHYYVSFVASDGTIRHQPFLIKTTPDGWFCKNGWGSGPFLNTPFQEIIHLVMHCEKNECEPIKT